MENGEFVPSAPSHSEIVVASRARDGWFKAMTIPERPRIYHILHVDRLASVVADSNLWCDAEIAGRDAPGTMIGINQIKQRRLATCLESHPGLRVGDCVPFYFCPRSVMLYVISKQNHLNLAYRGGQAPIVHLVADLRDTVAWAEEHDSRWAFTLSNAGSRYFEDRCDLSELGEINWTAVNATQWRDCKEEKQAEFLIERSFPWKLVLEIGVCSPRIQAQAKEVVRSSDHSPSVEIMRNWYY